MSIQICLHRPDSVEIVMAKELGELMGYADRLWVPVWRQKDGSLYILYDVLSFCFDTAWENALKSDANDAHEFVGLTAMRLVPTEARRFS